MPVVRGFLAEGGKVRILARAPESVAQRYSQAEVVAGSMSDATCVARVLADADAAFLMTPMGLRNDPSSEIAIAGQLIAGAKKAGLNHLIYTSVLTADDPSDVGILHAKYEIEAHIRAAEIPHTILRCGSYMEDVFDPRIRLLESGRFLFPIDPERRFSYTSQADIPKFVMRYLVGADRALNRAIDFVGPDVHSVIEVEALLSDAFGHSIKATPRLPYFYVFRALLPFFNARAHRFSSVIPLMQHFDRNGYSSRSGDMQSQFPGFRMTTLSEHLRNLSANAARHRNA